MFTISMQKYKPNIINSLVNNSVYIQFVHHIIIVKMMGVASFLVFLMVHCNFEILLSAERSALHYTIVTSPNETCEETEQCLTLSQFANNSSEYLNTNTTVMLHFLEGEHHLDSTIMIRNIDAFHMSSQRDSNVAIVCNDYSSRFEVNNVRFVHIIGLTFFDVQEMTSQMPVDLNWRICILLEIKILSVVQH